MIIAVLDTETTGLSVDKGAEVIEIAIAVIDTESQMMIRGFSTLLCPNNIPEEAEKDISLLNPAEKINRIKPESLLSDLSVDGDLTEAAYLLNAADVIVAHNASFDRPFVEAMLISRGYDLPDTPWVCSLKELNFPHATTSKKLTHLASDHGIISIGAHRAMVDVMMLVELIFKIEDLDEQMRTAKMPKNKYVVEPSRSYEIRGELKALGFKWNGKVWSKYLTDEQVENMISDGIPIIKSGAEGESGSSSDASKPAT